MVVAGSDDLRDIVSGSLQGGGEVILNLAIFVTSICAAISFAALFYFAVLFNRAAFRIQV